MSQVDFERVNYRAFPKFNVSNLGAKEAVLIPGDVLYIPPYWFHHVSSVGGLSVSISVCYESEVCCIHPLSLNNFLTGLLSQYKQMFQIIRFRDVMLQHPIPILSNWSLDARISSLSLYIYHLHNDIHHALLCLSSLLESRFSHFHLDDAAKGLHEEQLQEDMNFSFQMVDMPDELRRTLKASAQKVTNLLYEVDLESSIRDIERSNYVEDAICFVIGPLKVRPFLIMMIDIIHDDPEVLETKTRV
jgi:hypothetical protein